MMTEESERLHPHEALPDFLYAKMGSIGRVGGSKEALQPALRRS
jgi:hypothetical protein